MTDTDTDTGTGAGAGESPSPLFSADEGIEEIWVKAYQGEVLGEALFDGIADRLDDAERARKMRALATLERKTKEAIAPAVARAGVSTDPDPAMLDLAQALAVDVTWDVFMSSTDEITRQYIPLYRRIGELNPDEQAASDLLVAHEAALQDFARKELAGDSATSLDAIDALPHMH